jgi:AcrR family transcriptional regulator
VVTPKLSQVQVSQESVTLCMMSTAASPPEEDPRARAARTKRDRTRRALLDAADSAFGSRGWARTRVEDIAQSAGVSAATAYNHFPTKHALLAQVYAPIISPLLVQARSDIALGRPVAEALGDQVRALCRVCARNRMLSAAFFAAVSEYTIKVGRLPDPGDDADPRTLVPMPDALEMLIEHGQRTGELRHYPAARDVSGLLINTMLTRNVNRPYENPDTAAEILLTVIFGMLRPELLAGAERPFRHAH